MGRRRERQAAAAAAAGGALGAGGRRRTKLDLWEEPPLPPPPPSGTESPAAGNEDADTRALADGTCAHLLQLQSMSTTAGSFVSRKTTQHCVQPTIIVLGLACNQSRPLGQAAVGGANPLSSLLGQYSDDEDEQDAAPSNEAANKAMSKDAKPDSVPSNEAPKKVLQTSANPDKKAPVRAVDAEVEQFLSSLHSSGLLEPETEQPATTATPPSTSSRPSSQDAGELADGWQPIFDQATEQFYYWNIRTREITWERPVKGAMSAGVTTPPESAETAEARIPAEQPAGADTAVRSEPVNAADIVSASGYSDTCTLSSVTPLPPGWEAVLDEASNEYYYWHKDMGETTWVRPTGDQQPAQSFEATTAANAAVAAEVPGSPDASLAVTDGSQLQLASPYTLVGVQHAPGQQLPDTFKEGAAVPDLLDAPGQADMRLEEPVEKEPLADAHRPSTSGRGSADLTAAREAVRRLKEAAGPSLGDVAVQARIAIAAEARLRDWESCTQASALQEVFIHWQRAIDDAAVHTQAEGPRLQDAAEPPAEPSTTAAQSELVAAHSDDKEAEPAAAPATVDVPASDVRCEVLEVDMEGDMEADMDLSEDEAALKPPEQPPPPGEAPLPPLDVLAYAAYPQVTEMAYVQPHTYAPMAESSMAAWITPAAPVAHVEPAVAVVPVHLVTYGAPYTTYTTSAPPASSSSLQPANQPFEGAPDWEKSMFPDLVDSAEQQPGQEAPVAGLMETANQKKSMQKKRAAASILSGKSKKVSSLLDKWKAVRKEIDPQDEEDEILDEKALERKRMKEIEEWRAEQLRTGEAANNPNFMPVDTSNWRERVKRLKQNKTVPDQKPANGTAAVTKAAVTSNADKSTGKVKPDLKALSKGLPPGWQALHDAASGDVYYGNLKTKQTSWERPT
eukprot:jgi/Chlat1/3080/Chrsp21S03385